MRQGPGQSGPTRLPSTASPAKPWVERRAFSLAVAAFVLAWLVLSWPWLSGRVAVPWDAKAHFYPQLQFLAQSLHRGESPFWTPFVFSGSPQIADPQSLIFSPPFLLLALLDSNPSLRAADAVVFATLGLAGLALLLMFADRRWHPAGGWVAAIAFAFGASAAWRIQHVGQVLSLSFWVMALWLLGRALDRRSPGYGFAAGVAAGFMALGRDQVAYLGLWALFGVVLWHVLSAPSHRECLRGAARPVLAGVAAGALVAIVPVVLTALLSSQSNRLAIDLAGAGQGSLHPALLLTTVISNLFGADGPFNDYWGPPSPRWGPVDLYFARNMGVLYLGALPVALVAIGAVRGVLWSRDIRPFTILTGLLLLYGLGRYTPFFGPIFQLVPGIDLFRRPADATFLIGALLAILAGYMAHRWCSATVPSASRIERTIEGLLLASAFIVGAALASAKDVTGLATRPLIGAAGGLTASLVVLALIQRSSGRARRAAMVLALVLLTVDLAWNNGPNESTAMPPGAFAALDPDGRVPLLEALKTRVAATASDIRRDRVELTGLGFDWPNASLVHGLHNVLGYNPVRLGLYSAATGADDHVALPEQRKFSPLFPSYRSPLADLLGLRFIATGAPIERIDPRLNPGDVTLIATFEKGFLYENPRAMPRVLFASRSRHVDFKPVLDSGRWPDVDLNDTVLLSPRVTSSRPPEPAGNSDGARPATLRIATYRNTEVIVEVDATAPGHLVLNDPYHPWWFAEIDGHEAEIFQANVLFRAVAVAPGRHVVRFTFQPLRGAWRQLTSRTP